MKVREGTRKRDLLGAAEVVGKHDGDGDGENRDEWREVERGLEQRRKAMVFFSGLRIPRCLRISSIYIFLHFQF